MKDAPLDLPPIPAAAIARLKALVGPAGYFETEADTLAYRKSWRYGYVGKTPLVLRPANTSEVVEIVKICAAERIPIVPQGGNTGLTFAGNPGHSMGEIVVTTERMNKVRAVDLGNDTMTVEAGVVLQTLQQEAAKHNRLFPLSLGAQGSCRIGGNISTNAGGVQVLRYGNTRNLVLGLEVVLPDGRVWNGLRGLRKDNTGYDLKHLFIGGEGTLGIITAAVLRVFPKPTASETAWIAVDSPDAAVKLLSRMKERMGEQLSAFELIRRSIVEFTVQSIPGNDDPMPEKHPWYVLMDVTSQGAAGSLAEPLAEALGAAMEDGLVRDAVIATSQNQANKLWKMREDMADAQRAIGGSVSHDVSVPVSRIPQFITETDAAMEARFPGVRHCCFGHVGDGNMHYNPIRPEGWEQAKFLEYYEEINRIVHDRVIAHGGSISAEHGIGRIRLEENYHYKSDVELDLMRAV
ncbi:MAG: FAD-binding oxidoreductase, partial [Hyphomicrobiaceae bacterium]|nr:FAD-binding oxidoreductase [Hyphomicrobiaceae bacterium]